MIPKYTTSMSSTKTLSGISYYTSLIPAVVPLDTFQFVIMAQDGDRFDSLATRYYNDASKWWIIAKANNLVNGTMFITGGTRILIPSAGLL